MPHLDTADQADPDLDLMARVGRGEPAAVRDLVARKLPRLLAVAQRLLGDRGEAEDVAQEAFVRAWKQAPVWEAGVAKVDTWLHRVVLNLCHDRLRSPRRRHEQDMDELPEVPDTAASPESQLSATQQDSRVAAAMAALPVRQREALVLQYYRDLPNTEAAALMDVSVEALESLLARARRNLRAALAEPAGAAEPKKEWS